MVSKEDMKGGSPRTTQEGVFCVLVQDFLFLSLFQITENIHLETYLETKDPAIPKSLLHAAKTGIGIFVY